MMGVDQGPVFSMASISRLGMMSAYAGLNTMSLYTKALMNLTSIMFMMIGLVVPWDKLFPNIYERIRVNILKVIQPCQDIRVFEF